MGNGSVQMDFLTALLDDTELQVISNFYARSFWFGTIVVIGIATLLNLFLRVRTGLRQVINCQQLRRLALTLLSGSSLLPAMLKLIKMPLPTHGVM
jgi:hypothetical protein